MTTYSIDTAAAIKRMAKAGFSQEQAEAIVETFVRSKDALITKADLDKLEVRIMVPIVTGQVATAAILFTLLKLFP